MEDIKLYTVYEAAEILKVNRRTIVSMIKSKRIKARNVGLGEQRKFYRIPESEILKFK